MFVQSICVSVVNPNAKSLHCEQSDCRVIDRERIYRDEQIQKLQLAQLQLEHERDAVLPEHQMICDLEDELHCLETELCELTKRLHCSIDSGDKRFAEAKTHTEHLVEKLSPELKRLLDAPLGQQYTEATWWLCDSRCPRFPGTQSITQAEVEMLMANVACVLKKLERVEQSDSDALKALGDALMSTWTARALAVVKLFRDTDICEVASAAKWNEFSAHDMPADNIATALLLLAKKTNNADSPCVTELLRQLYPLQRQDRDFHAAVSAAFTCNSGGKAALQACITLVRELLNRCNMNLTELVPMRECLRAPMCTVQTSGDAKRAALLEHEICERKDALQRLKCVLSDRHDRLAVEIARLKDSVCRLIAEGEATADSDSLSAPVVRVNDNPRQNITMQAAVHCGATLRLQLVVAQPGLEYPFAMTVYAHHEDRIAMLRAESDCVRARQKQWVQFTAHPVEAEAQKALLSVLNDCERAELTRVVKRIHGNDKQTLDPTLIDNPVAQAMVCFWAKVLGNIGTQLTTLCREQEEGVVPHVDDSSSVVFDNFDWAQQGLYTFRIANETDGTTITEHVQLSVIPSTKSQFNTWQEWAKRHVLNAYEVNTDFQMPDVGAPMEQQKQQQQQLEIPHEHAGAALLTVMQQLDISDVSAHFNSPNNFLVWLSKQPGNPLHTHVATRVQERRSAVAHSVADRMRRQGRIVDVQAVMQEVLDTESWQDFFASSLFPSTDDSTADIALPPTLATSGNFCEPIPSADHEARRRAKMSRAVVSALLRKYPAFALVFLTQCSYRHLMCALDDRSPTMRWAVSDIQETEHVAIQCNDFLLQHLRRIQLDLALARSVNEAHVNGPFVSDWYARLNDAWATYAAALGELDCWIESANCTPDLSTKMATPSDECVRLKNAVNNSYDELSKITLQEQQLPRCMPSEHKLRELYDCSKPSVVAPMQLWKCVVDSHEALVLSFAKESPWQTVSQTCQPLEWFETALVLAKRANKPVMDALAALTKALHSRHLPALHAWLAFCVTTELEPAIRWTSCEVLDLLRDQRLQNGLCADVEQEDRRLRAMFSAARQGQQLVSSYEAVLAPLAQVHEAVRAAIPEQPELKQIADFLALLDARYRTEALKQWRERVGRHPLPTLPRDTVTSSMGTYANRYESSPMSDSEALDKLAASDLLKPAFAQRLRGLIEWMTAIRHLVHPPVANDMVSLTNAEIVALDFGFRRSRELAKRFEKLPVPTMSELMCRYRDVVWTAGAENRLMLVSNEYFDTQLMMATLYYALASELHRQFALINDDLLTDRLCLGVKPHQTLWDEPTSVAVSGMLQQLPLALRALEDTCTRFPELFDTVLNEYRMELVREAVRELQREMAVQKHQPWLNSNVQVISEERAHLIETARRVFKVHLRLNSDDGSQFVSDMIDQYETMLQWLSDHYVHVPKPAEVCALGNGFVLALHEYALVSLIVSHDSNPHHAPWAGTDAEHAWINYGSDVWKRALDLEEQVLELAYSSPGCALGETPAESWRTHFDTLKMLNTSWKGQYSSQSLAVAAKNQLAPLFDKYQIARNVLVAEVAREALVNVGERVYFLPQWLYADLTVLDVGVSLLAPKNGAYITNLADALDVPPVTPASVASTLQSIDTRTALGRINGVQDSGQSLSLQLFPLEDVVLARVFYAVVNRFASARTDDSDVKALPAHVVANIASVLRYHGIRSAIFHLLQPAQYGGSKCVVAGRHSDQNTLVDSAGGATYFDALGAFFYCMQTEFTAEFEALLADASVFGVNPDSILGNNTADGDRYAAYVRGEAEASQCMANIQQALHTLEQVPLTTVDEVRKGTSAERIRALWSSLRASVWWLALLQTLEDKHLMSYEWFTKRFLPTFVMLDASASIAPLFVLDPQSVAASTVSPAQPVLGEDHYDMLAWMCYSLVTNSRGTQNISEKTANDITRQRVHELVAEIRERFVAQQQSLDMSMLISVPKEAPPESASVHDRIHHDLVSTKAHTFLLQNYLGVMLGSNNA